MNILISPTNIAGLTLNEQEMLQDLIDVYNEHSVKNYEKEKYYEGKSVWC